MPRRASGRPCPETIESKGLQLEMRTTTDQLSDVNFAQAQVNQAFKKLHIMKAQVSDRELAILAVTAVELAKKYDIDVFSEALVIQVD